MDYEEDIIDLLSNYIKSGDKKIADLFLSRINECSGRKFYPFVNKGNVNLLFYEDKDGISLFENIFKNGGLIPQHSLFAVSDDMRIIRILIKYNQYSFFSITEDLMFEELEDGKLIVDYMFENNHFSPIEANLITKHPQIIDYIIKYNRIDFISFLREDLLFEKYSQDKLLIEYVL